MRKGETVRSHFFNLQATTAEGNPTHVRRGSSLPVRTELRAHSVTPHVKQRQAASDCFCLLAVHHLTGRVVPSEELGGLQEWRGEKNQTKDSARARGVRILIEHKRIEVRARDRMEQMLFIVLHKD